MSAAYEYPNEDINALPPMYPERYDEFEAMMENEHGDAPILFTVYSTGANTANEWVSSEMYVDLDECI